MSNLKWCCEGFKHSYNLGGQRGFSVMVEKLELLQKPTFFMQSRAIDILESFEILSAEGTISLASEIPIHYCPWCGKNLSKWYKKHIDEMIRPEFQLHNEF